MRLKGMYICLMMIAVLSLSIQAFAVPPYINYQGKLADNAGQPITGTVNLTFKIYDVDSGGVALWTEVHNSVAVEEGIVSLELGMFTTLDLDFDNDYWLGVQVGADNEMTPRKRLTSASFSFRADVATTMSSPYLRIVSLNTTETETATVGNWEELVKHTIPGGLDISRIIVLMTIRAGCTDDNTGTYKNRSKSSYQLMIGLDGLESMKRQENPVRCITDPPSSGGATWQRNTLTLAIPYTPLEIERTNGFNVIINGYRYDWENIAGQTFYKQSIVHYYSMILAE
ncbi:hypothetical protein ACFL27_01620 [candidate division CSSED10-310 bacterium]|uniref:Uncharacterized protein n=1 Tax=candidate division CSSED10-310 bacterium TaxID=2855610 RepID=A0ABV6YRZ7_UNCC1